MNPKLISPLQLAQDIYDKYYTRFNGELQGLCLVITRDICNNVIGSVPVRGYLCAATGWRRSHWWVEIDGKTFDPFGDLYSKTEPGFYREIIGRDDRDLLEDLIEG